MVRNIRFALMICFGFSVLSGCATNKIINVAYDENAKGYKAYLKRDILSPDGT